MTRCHLFFLFLNNEGKVGFTSEDKVMFTSGKAGTFYGNPQCLWFTNRKVSTEITAFYKSSATTVIVLDVKSVISR